jgi:RNA polymerase sigma-70 factor (ECF subfamily)
MTESRRTELEALYRERYAGFRSALATVVGSYDEARDVVQDAFAAALTDIGSFRGEGTLEAWVMRIGLRLAIRRRNRREPGGRIDDAWAVAALVEPERDPELACAIRQLSERRRLVVFLHYYADLSYASIGELAGISEGTVAATLAQARTALRTAMEPKEVPR